MRTHQEDVPFYVWAYDYFDYFRYLIIKSFHKYILGHYLHKHPHCEDKNCTFDLVLCFNCKNKILGWLTKGNK